MARTADAVVIGCGIIGASTAYHLARKGMKRVVVLERYVLAAGATGKTAGLVRMHYSNEAVARMAVWSRDLFLDWTERIGGPSPYHRTGWVFLVPPEAVPAFHENIAMLERIGVDSEVLGPDDVRKLIPGVQVDDVAVAEHEAKSGYADGHTAVSGLATAAKGLGVEIVLMSPVTGIRLERGRIRSVRTDREEYETPVVVNAAGPWAGRVSRLAGVELPLELSREEEVVFQPPADYPAAIPAVSDMAKRIYFRREAGGMILVGQGHPKANQPADPDAYRETADFPFIEHVARQIARRIPAMQEGLAVKGYAGLYNITPDWNLILSAVPEVPGYFVATGGSGHGFKLGPAAGMMMAELVADGKSSTLDVAPFRLARFAEGALFRTTYGGNRG